MQTDTNNAHVRGTTSRSREVIAADAERLLTDPAFIRGFEVVRTGLIGALEEIRHDGQPETDAFERELCRALRTLHAVRRAIVMGVQTNQLRTADFRPQQEH